MIISDSDLSVDESNLSREQTYIFIDVFLFNDTYLHRIYSMIYRYIYIYIYLYDRIISDSGLSVDESNLSREQMYIFIDIPIILFYGTYLYVHIFNDI
jgi:hypothetical protein